MLKKLDQKLMSRVIFILNIHFILFHCVDLLDLVRDNIRLALLSHLQELTQTLKREEKQYYLKLKEIGGDDSIQKKKNIVSEEAFLNDAEYMEMEYVESVAQQR